MTPIQRYAATLLSVLLVAACSNGEAPGGDGVPDPFGLNGTSIELTSEDANAGLVAAARPFFTGAVPTSRFDDLIGVPSDTSRLVVDVSVSEVVLPEADAFPSSLEIERFVIEDLELADGTFGGGGSFVSIDAQQDGLGWRYQPDGACEAGAACTFARTSQGAGSLSIELTGATYNTWFDIVTGGLPSNSVRAGMFVEFASSLDAETATVTFEIERARVFGAASAY
ncbi:MAG: hypothetical protein U5K81_03585 [Trueperaceae bacterium]|nr:hypothetical protein [Trueperaceae bacterium]